MSLTYRVISIGALSRNPFWNEKQPKRLAHATTVLVRDDQTTILVDPSLPAEIMTQRLDERSGLTPEKIDAVFLTTFRPVHRRSLALFERADWFLHEPEIEAVRQHLDEEASRAEPSADEVRAMVGEEQALLKRIKPAPEKLTSRVHLYPTPGVTPGSAGLLLALPARTVVIAGDAVVTQDHYEARRIYNPVTDLERARESFADIVEIADEIVPGHDHAFAVLGR